MFLVVFSFVVLRVVAEEAEEEVANAVMLFVRFRDVAASPLLP
jgi:hypothetical protein